MGSAGQKAKWANKQERQDYYEWRRESSKPVKSLFSPEELLIFYLHFALDLGCVNIKRRTGYTEHQLKKVIKRFKEYAKYASVVYEHEMTIAQAYEEKILISSNDESND